MKLIKIIFSVLLAVAACSASYGQTVRYPYIVGDASGFTLPGGAGGDMGPVIVSRDAAGGVKTEALMNGTSPYPTSGYEWNSDQRNTARNRVAGILQITKQDVDANGYFVSTLTTMKWKDGSTYPAAEACEKMNSIAGRGTGWRLPTLNEIWIIVALYGVRGDIYNAGGYQVKPLLPYSENPYGINMLPSSQYRPIGWGWPSTTNIYMVSATELFATGNVGALRLYINSGVSIGVWVTGNVKTSQSAVRCVRELQP